MITPMRKAMLILPVLISGLLLVFIAWYTSYPVALDSLSEFVPDKISPFFWVGVSVVCASFYVMGISFERNWLKGIATAGIIVTIHSYVYFFWSNPGIDADHFRGLAEYFIQTGDLNYLVPYHSYYQWPVLFLLSRIANTMGLDPRFFEFVLFGLFGCLFVFSLHSLARKFSSHGAIFAVISYFVIMWWYLNYYVVPFTLAFILLLILIMLDSFGDNKPATKLTMLILFTTMTLTHSFVPFFFIVYAFIRYIISKDRKYLGLFLTTLVIQSLMLTSRATLFFQVGIEDLLGLTEYTKVSFTQQVTKVLTATNSLHEIAQTIARINFVFTGLVAGIGFVIILLKRKLDTTNLALLFTGGVFLAGAAIMPILGTRSLHILVIPLTLGVAYLQTTKYKRYFQCLFLITLILFVSAPAYSLFNSTSKYMPSQQESVYQGANFLIDYYHPNETSAIGTDLKTTWYLASRLATAPYIRVGTAPLSRGAYDSSDYSCILYTIGLEHYFLLFNYTYESAFQETNEFSVFYSSGNCQVLVKR